LETRRVETYLLKRESGRIRVILGVCQGGILSGEG